MGLKWLLGGQAGSDGERRPRLQVELLEDRAVPAITISPAAPAQLVQSLLGFGVKATNVSYTGVAAASGSFTGGTSAVGFDSGIILSSGHAADVAPPESNFASTDNMQPGDAQLAATAGVPTAQTFDAAVLQFDFIPKGNMLTFQYCFGSEEYPNFAPPVSTSFNDIFAFYLNGKNVALLPNGQAVGINTVNAVTNQQFFINNAANGMDAGPQVRDTSLDGLTVVLTVTAPVNPGVVNHIKLGVSDVTDGIYDTDVFIKGGSFGAGALNPKFYYPFRYVFDPKTLTYRGNLTFENNDADPLPALTLFFALPKLPPGVKLLNPTGISKAGAPYIQINAPPLPGHVPLYIPLIFSNPLHVPLSTFFKGFPVQVFIGPTPP